MIEARITCTCANIIIGDLGLRLTKGAVVYVGEKEAHKSKDLLVAARAGGVMVAFVTRATVVRQPTAVVGRPKRELPNFAARVSPLAVMSIVTPITTPDFVPISQVIPPDDDIVEMMNSVLGDEVKPPRKKKPQNG
jgi:hypothetical protein